MLEIVLKKNENTVSLCAWKESVSKGKINHKQLIFKTHIFI